MPFPLPSPPPRFVFVAGLHRTGTSLVSRILTAHPSISAINGAGVPEDEGCYLQGAIPHTARHGRPGHYATDPAQHHAEGSRYDTLGTKRRLLADWGPWFDPACPWWLEKSPVNLVRMRLYQQLLPRSQFIVILRHPQVMAAALGKWTDMAPGALTDYALDAYRIAFDDIAYLHACLMLRYEDLVADPDRCRAALLAFLGLPDHDPGIAVRDGNRDYERFEPPSPGQCTRMARLGYAPDGGTEDWPTIVRHPLRSIRENAIALLPGPGAAAAVD